MSARLARDPSREGASAARWLQRQTSTVHARLARRGALRIGLAVLSLGALAARAPAAPRPPERTAAEQALHLDWLDANVSPAVDFYRFANGGWQERNPIPPAYASWSVIDVLRLRTQRVVRGILERASADRHAAPGSIEQKIGDFYASGMDEAAVDAAGVAPLGPELQRIAAIARREDLVGVIAHLQMIGVDAAFGFGEMQSYADSERVVGVATQGGLGLPDRSYYFDPDLAKVRDAYRVHVARTLGLVGERPAEARADAAAVFGIETRLAKASLPPAALRDPHATWHPMDRAALAKVTPAFPWPRYFADVGRPDVESIDVATPGFFPALSAVLRDEPLPALRAYLRFHLLATYSPYLSRPFQDEALRMKEALTGVREMLPRWQRVADAENEVLGFAVGKKYVEEVFPPSAKASAIALVHAIRHALEQDLAMLPWMSAPTRARALEKLHEMTERIGYPDQWRDYGGLIIDRGPWVLDVLRGKAFEMTRQIAKIDGPVDRTEWQMTPQTVNAYYDPSMNDINFPAAILQPPFFDPAAPIAVRYGGIGFVMGHEMTHGFDDQGAQFDGRGNLRNWWTPRDYARFRARTACIADQFSRYAVDGVHLDGRLVEGEATADLGGLELSYRALHAASVGEARPDVAGFTPDQQFFLAAAHIWASNVRPADARLRAATDPHPPPRYRVDGTVANLPQFQAAFHVAEESPMVSHPRCTVW